MWNHVVTKKSVSIFDFRFFKVATLCLDDNFASWHSFNQLHLECFSNSFEGVPTCVEHLLAAFPSHLRTNSSQTNWVEVG